MHLRLVGLAAALALGAAPSAHADRPPARGAFVARFSGHVTTLGAVVVFEGHGRATRMGHVRTHGRAVVTGADAACAGLPNVNVETLTDTAGDSVTIRSRDIGCPVLSSPGTFHGYGHYIVVRGTGRFRDAHGEGSLEGLVDFVAGTFHITAVGDLTR